jgi:exonuclease SbcD
MRWRRSTSCFPRLQWDCLQHSVLRLELSGQTPLAWRLRRDSDLFLEQVSNRARAKGSVWIDKIVHMQVPPSQAVKGDDPRSELGALMEGLTKDESFVSRALGAADDIIGDLPPELRAAFGKTEDEQVEQVRQLLGEGIDDIIARMMAGGKEEGAS